MRKQHPIRIVEIHIHRSKKNPKLGHAVAVLFPCNHHKYLGLTLYKGESDSISYRAQFCRVIKFEDFEITDKEVCKLCPHDQFWIDDLGFDTSLDDVVSVLETIDDL